MDHALAGNAGLAGTSTCPLSAKLVPRCGVLWGAAVNPVFPAESWDSAFAAFAQASGRSLDVAHYYEAGTERFPNRAELARSRRAGGPPLFFFNWKPAPRLTWSQVAAGAVDAHIDAEARRLRQTMTKPFFLAIQHEPEDSVRPEAGSGMTTADYRAMFRHVVLRLRADGVTNAVTVMDYRGSPRWSQEMVAALYPGDDVVDWIGFDPYLLPGAQWDQPFAGALDRRNFARPEWPGFYTWATGAHPSKPLMLAEWGISQRFTDAEVVRRLKQAQLALSTHPALKALIYWDAANNPPVGATRMQRPAVRRAFADLARSSAVTGRAAAR
ncbi:MAG: endoglucanase [Actinomycetota bacterium]|nr:endoglucanase [Actinomycetota bacterium]